MKARNHSRVASALLHSEGIAYKPPCGEIAMCREWTVRHHLIGLIRPLGTGHPGPERGPLGRRNQRSGALLKA